MSTYKAPLDDIRFALYDVLDCEKQFAALGFAEVDRATADAVLDEAARFTETVLAPLNKVGDEVGCKYDAASGDVVVRLYEAHGARTTGVLRAGFDYADVARTDLLERTVEPAVAPLDDGGVPLTLRPFEIVTLRFSGVRAQ